MLDLSGGRQAAMNAAQAAISGLPPATVTLAGKAVEDARLWRAVTAALDAADTEAHRRYDTLLSQINELTTRSATELAQARALLVTEFAKRERVLDFAAMLECANCFHVTARHDEGPCTGRKADGSECGCAWGPGAIAEFLRKTLKGDSQ